MHFLANIRRACKLTTYYPTKALSYAINYPLQYRSYGSKSTGNSKFCKGKKSLKKQKRHADRWKRGSTSKKKLKGNASTLSPVALISDRDKCAKVALIPINLFEENQSDRDAFRDALAILALLKKNSHQVELFMESCNDLKKGDAFEIFRSDGSYAEELEQLDKEILATNAEKERQEEQPTLMIKSKYFPEGNNQALENERVQRHLLPTSMIKDLNNVSIAGMQLNFEMNMTNIRDAILNPKNLKMMQDKRTSDIEDSTLALSTNIHMHPDNKKTIPLQLNALIHGTVNIDPTKFSEEKLGRLQIPQFNEYVTAVAANLCSKALKKGFPMNVSRSMHKTGALKAFERTNHSDKPFSELHAKEVKNESNKPQSEYKLVDAQERDKLNSTADDSTANTSLVGVESVDEREADDAGSRRDASTLTNTSKCAVHDQNVDTVNKYVEASDRKVKQAERAAEATEIRAIETDKSVRVAGKSVEAMEGSEGNTETAGRTLATANRNEEATEGSMETEEKAIEAADRNTEAEENGTNTAETVETAERKVEAAARNAEIPTRKIETVERTVELEDTNAEITERIVERAGTLVKAADRRAEIAENVFEPSNRKEEAKENVEEEAEAAEVSVDRVAKPNADPSGRKTIRKAEERINATELKAWPAGGRKKDATETLLDAEESRANVGKRSANEGTMIANGLKMGPDAENENVAATQRNEANPTAESKEGTTEEADSLEKNAEVLEKIVDALEIPENNSLSIANERIIPSSVQADMDKSEIARQIELSKGLDEDLELSKYADENFEFSKNADEMFEEFKDARDFGLEDQIAVDLVNQKMECEGYFPIEMESATAEDEMKDLYRRYNKFKGEIDPSDRSNTLKGLPSSYAIGLSSATAIPGKGNKAGKETPTNKRDPHIVCVRKGKKGCKSPGLAENAPYIAKKSSPSDTGSKRSSISLRLLECGLYQKALDEASSKRNAEKLGKRSSSSCSKSDSKSDKKKKSDSKPESKPNKTKGSDCRSSPPCQNKSEKQKLPSDTKKPSQGGSNSKCKDPCKRSSSTSATVKSKRSSSSSSKSNDTCKRMSSKEPQSGDSCKRSACSSKKSSSKNRSSSSSSKKSDPCKRSLSKEKSKSKDPCKRSSSLKKTDPCKMSSTKEKSKSEDTCKRSSSSTSKKSDPCKRSSSKEKSKTKDPCKSSSSSCSKKSDPCMRSSSESKDPCKRSSSKSKDPCKSSSSSSSKKSDPCRRSSSKSKDPCKRSSSSSSNKSDPCKRTPSKSKDPCKRSSSSSSNKSDPCKRSSSKSKDPCKSSSSSSSKKSDPCKRSSSKSKDPCKRSSSSSSKKSDPCKRSSSKSKDPCKRSSSSSSKKSDPCKRSSSKSKDPCKRSSSSSSKKSDPCKRSSSKSKDPCKRSPSSSSKKSSKKSSSTSCSNKTDKSDTCPVCTPKRKYHALASFSSPLTKCFDDQIYAIIRSFSDKCSSKEDKRNYVPKDPHTNDLRKATCKQFSWRDDRKRRKRRKKKKNCYPDETVGMCPDTACYRIYLNYEGNKRIQRNKRCAKRKESERRTGTKENKSGIEKGIYTNKLQTERKSSLLKPVNCVNQQQNRCYSSGDIENEENGENEEAVVLSPFKVCKKKSPIQPIKENDVGICIDCVALSDSDIHLFETGAKEYPDLTLGNEASGIVQKVGKNVTNLKSGDHVAIECGVPCGRCSLCHAGRYNLCQQLTFKGCLKKYCTHPASFCHKISKRVPLSYAAMVYQLSLGCNACVQGGIKPNSNVAVLGSCAMTLCTAMCAKAMGCSNVGVICTSADTQDIVFENITEKVECMDSQTKAKGVYRMICDSLGTNPDLIINCLCSTRTMNASIMALKPGGTCVISGFLSECAAYNVMDALMKEIRIIPSFRSKNMFPLAIRLLEHKQIPIDCIIADCLEWKRVEVGFEKALSEANCGPRKVIVQCHEGDDNVRVEKN